jgi:hypothetical protein
MNFYEFYARLCGQNNLKYEQRVKTAVLMHRDGFLPKNIVEES